MPKPYTVCSSCCVPGTISTWVSGLGGDAKDLGWTALQTPRNQTPRRSTMICPPSLGHGIPMPVRLGVHTLLPAHLAGGRGDARADRQALAPAMALRHPRRALCRQA